MSERRPPPPSPPPAIAACARGAARRKQLWMVKRNTRAVWRGRRRCWGGGLAHVSKPRTKNAKPAGSPAPAPHFCSAGTAKEQQLHAQSIAA